MIAGSFITAVKTGWSLANYHHSQKNKKTRKRNSGKLIIYCQVKIKQDAQKQGEKLNHLSSTNTLFFPELSFIPSFVFNTSKSSTSSPSSSTRGQGNPCMAEVGRTYGGHLLQPHSAQIEPSKAGCPGSRLDSFCIHLRIGTPQSPS